MTARQSPAVKSVKVKVKVKVSVPLPDMMLRQLAFLKEVDRWPCLYGGRAVGEAIRRYERLWLPLAAQYDRPLEAPLDVHWVWHVHMLAPRCYIRDCQALVGCVVQHKFASDERAREAGVQRAWKAWTERYGEGEPFAVDLRRYAAGDSGGETEEEEEGYRSACSYDLRAGISRQKVFYYQVSLPHFGDTTVLKDAAKRYCCFLQLKLYNPDALLVPCYDVDLAWHAHQLSPQSYAADTTALLGRVFNHDDTLTDRSPGGRLATADTATRQLWVQTYGSPLPVAGVMYRGDPPAGRLYSLTARDVFFLSSKVARVTIVAVELKSSSADTTPDNGSTQKLTLKVRLGRGGCTLVKVSASGTRFDVRHRFTFDTRLHDDLHLEISTVRHRLLGVVSRHLFASGCVSLRSTVDASDPREPTTATETAACRLADGEAGGVAVVSLSVEPAQRGPTYLMLDVGLFHTATMPENVEQLWGPIPLPQLPSGDPNTCIIASHRMFNHANQLTFTCRIVHSMPCMMSGVQVYLYDRMAVVSHLIGSDQLPTLNQVSNSDCATLDPTLGERAMLIKDNYGDWGICVGVWKNFKMGANQGQQSWSDGLPFRGIDGHFEARFLDLRLRRWHRVKFGGGGGGGGGAKRQRHRFSVAALEADLSSGSLLVHARSDEVAQAICLAFSIAMLQVLCEPQPLRKATVAVRAPEAAAPDTANGKTSTGDGYAMLLAAGLYNAIPCNSFIKASGGGCAACCQSDAGGCDAGGCDAGGCDAGGCDDGGCDAGGCVAGGDGGCGGCGGCGGGCGGCGGCGG